MHEKYMDANLFYRYYRNVHIILLLDVIIYSDLRQ